MESFLQMVATNMLGVLPAAGIVTYIAIANDWKKMAFWSLSIFILSTIFIGIFY